MNALLFGVEPTDALTYTLVCAAPDSCRDRRSVLADPPCDDCRSYCRAQAGLKEVTPRALWYKVRHAHQDFCAVRRFAALAACHARAGAGRKARSGCTKRSPGRAGGASTRPAHRPGDHRGGAGAEGASAGAARLPVSLDCVERAAEAVRARLPIGHPCPPRGVRTGFRPARQPHVRSHRRSGNPRRHVDEADRRRPARDHLRGARPGSGPGPRRRRVAGRHAQPGHHELRRVHVDPWAPGLLDPKDRTADDPVGACALLSQGTAEERLRPPDRGRGRDRQSDDDGRRARDRHGCVAAPAADRGSRRAVDRPATGRAETAAGTCSRSVRASRCAARKFAGRSGAFDSPSTPAKASFCTRSDTKTADACGPFSIGPPSRRCWCRTAIRRRTGASATPSTKGNTASAA